MPDITMCTATNCNKKLTCRRNQESGTKPSQWQSMSNFHELPEYTDELGCSYYWEIERKLEVI